VIGSDGFGYANDNGKWIKMLHLGGVTIGDNVEIGSNTSIDRGFIEDTTIADNVIIDNLVQIGHNVVIGQGTAIAGCVGIAGSASIGENCLLGGGAGIAGHISITNNVSITATSAVNHNITKPGVYSSGFPARENSAWLKNVARFQFIDSMSKKIRQLEKDISTIKEG
jgi:UDP-3-O-[3-hydroxymyristoyl] glucosamine N-acyltransferase